MTSNIDVTITDYDATRKLFVRFDTKEKTYKLSVNYRFKRYDPGGEWYYTLDNSQIRLSKNMFSGLWVSVTEARNIWKKCVEHGFEVV
jgi:hypothetical protein